MTGISTPNLPTYHLDDASVVIREAENNTTDQDWIGGMNKGGSNAPGVGICTAFIDPKLEDWTVLDQAEAARTPQNSEHLGGDGLGAGEIFPDGVSVINAVMGADVNNTLSFIVAAAQAAPGIGMGAANADPLNQTDVTVEIGDRVWGTNTVA